MHIQESGEMYLETIRILTENGKAVRAIDICEHMGYSKPSVSRAMGLLKNGGYINVDKNGYITLTSVGLEVANKIYERHKTLAKLLVHIGVNRETAVEDACKIEHHISEESFEAMKNYLEKINRDQ